MWWLHTPVLGEVGLREELSQQHTVRHVLDDRPLWRAVLKPDAVADLNKQVTKSFICVPEMRARACIIFEKQQISITTHTHPFNGPFSRTTRVGQYQKGKTDLDFTETRDSEWQWHQLGICKSAPCSRQITTPAPHHSVFYRPDALPAAQPTALKYWSQKISITRYHKIHKQLNNMRKVLTPNINSTLQSDKAYTLPKKYFVSG